MSDFEDAMPEGKPTERILVGLVFGAETIIPIRELNIPHFVCYRTVRRL